MLADIQRPTHTHAQMGGVQASIVQVRYNFLIVQTKYSQYMLPQAADAHKKGQLLIRMVSNFRSNYKQDCSALAGSTAHRW